MLQLSLSRSPCIYIYIYIHIHTLSCYLKIFMTLYRKCSLTALVSTSMSQSVQNMLPCLVCKQYSQMNQHSGLICIYKLITLVCLVNCTYSTGFVADMTEQLYHELCPSYKQQLKTERLKQGVIEIQVCNNVHTSHCKYT